MRVLTPMRAIRKKCLDCAGSPSEVKKCEVKACPLFPYRLGKNPNRKGTLPKGEIPAAFKKTPALRGEIFLETSGAL